MHTIEKDDCEWDARKAAENLRKHGVRFGDAAHALCDELSRTRRDPDSNGEERFISLGVDRIFRVLVTVFAFRGDRVRIISSRKATLTERRLYRQR